MSHKRVYNQGDTEGGVYNQRDTEGECHTKGCIIRETQWEECHTKGVYNQGDTERGVSHKRSV